MARPYRLGRRREEVDRTRSAILAAARQVVIELGAAASLVKVAERAGVSRITVYNQFGSRAQLLQALARLPGSEHRAEEAEESGRDPTHELELRIEQACATWATDPALYRRLNALRGEQDEQPDRIRGLAERLAARDRLRPGCSITEAEDVIAILTSFPAFDRLHKSGRRAPAAVAHILIGMATGVMRAPSV
jgi:AcrR family transcriptional regulator